MSAILHGTLKEHRKEASQQNSGITLAACGTPRSDNQPSAKESPARIRGVGARICPIFLLDKAMAVSCGTGQPEGFDENFFQ